MSGDRLTQYEARISLNLPGSVEAALAAAVGDVRALFPNSLYALKALAESAQVLWINYASGATALPNGHRMHRWTGSYAQSIRIGGGGENGGLEYVIYTEDPKAEWLEHGTPAWDMRKLLGTSHKVRRTAEGTRYLIIPFRWGTPGTLAVGEYTGRELPLPVNTWWAGRAASLIASTYQEPSLIDPSVSVTRRRYQWGDRLTAADVSELGLDPESAPGQHMVGMVKFDNPDGGHSSKMTFRVLSERSHAGWIHPGMPALHVAKAVHEWVMREYPALTDRALELDVAQIVKRAGG